MKKQNFVNTLILLGFFAILIYNNHNKNITIGDKMIEKKNFGLYIHIPFCSRKCDYCDFVSYSMDKHAQQDYLEALFTEIDLVKDKYEDITFDTIYIGGGTPSIVYEGFIASLSRKLYSSFHFADKFEYTIEINPSSFTKPKFFEYVESGVNRISVGVQCIDSKLLRDNGRLQSVKNVKKTFKLLFKSSFPNVSADIMIGLPGQSVRSVVSTLEFLLQYNIKHISLYTLQVERNTMLYNKLQRGVLKPIKEKKLTAMYERLDKILSECGFIKYEVSNYCLPGFEARHNSKYWNNSNFLGLGVSAHSYIDGYRYFNTKRLDTYIEHMEKGESAVYKREYISIETRRTERIMLSLRTSKGLNLDDFRQEFNENLLETRKDAINNLIKQGMLELKDGVLIIPKNKFIVSNSIIVELL